MDGTCTLTDSTFMNCVAAHGGGLYVARAGALLQGCLFLFNRALEKQGGGLFAELDSMVNVSSSIFKENIGFHGGGISVRDRCLLGLAAGVRVESNMAVWGGGFLAERDSTVEVCDSSRIYSHVHICPHAFIPISTFIYTYI